MTASYHVKLHNLGRAARVVHDGVRPIRIPAGEWVEDILSEETIKRIKAEKHERDVDEEPRLEVQQGAKAEDAPPPPSYPHDEHEAHGSPHVASAAEENGNAASHKKRGPPHA